MVTLSDAQRVRSEVLNRYEAYLPPGLASKVRTRPIAEIFSILPANDYQRHFDAYFKSFFAAINVVALGPALKEQGVDMLRFARRGGSFPCPAFCSPAMNPTDRRIYVNNDAGNSVGTLYHEFIHYLSHGNFYPEMYAMGGRSPIILEGVTEYLTREVSPEVRKDRADNQKYQAWFSQVSSTITGGTATARMARMAFRGDLDDVRTLGGVVPQHL